MAYTEMVSVAGLSYKSAKTWVLVEPEPEEPQICVQLFGTKPEQFAFAVDAVQERVGEKLSLIDINMACPARKVITKGEGSALMKEPELAASLVEACVREARVPVTVKIRLRFRGGGEHGRRVCSAHGAGGRRGGGGSRAHRQSALHR